MRPHRSTPPSSKRRSKRFAFAHELGRLRRRHHLQELAMEVARRVLEGEVDEDDANAIYLAYRSPDGDAEAEAATARV
jgi:hypothetical protein